MTYIYSQAQKVIIWLGEADEQTHLAFASFEWRVQVYGGKAVPEEPMTYPLSADEVKKLDEVSSLMQRSCFSRVWIIQEVVVARSAGVTCGSFEMDFATLVAGARWYGLYVPNHGSNKTSIYSMQSNGQRMIMDGLGIWHELFRTERESEILRLENLLFHTRNSKASNPRDHLYALTGFAGNVKSSDFRVDYSASIPDVFTQAARVILGNLGGVNILCAVRPKNNLSRELPSWVPDGRDSWHIECFGSQAFVKHAHFSYNASRGKTPAIHDIGNPRKLAIQGLPVDFIVKMLDHWVGLDNKDLRQFWFSGPQVKEIVNMQGLSGTYRFTQEPIHEAYLKTLTADLLIDSDRLSVESCDVYWPAWTRWIQARGHMDDMYCEEMPLAVRSEITYRITQNTRSRTLFLTDGGLLGLDPLTLLEQDKVVMFSGGSIPFVVRGNPGEDFELIGECYVHGIMNGELMQPDKDQWPPYDFHLV